MNKSKNEFGGRHFTADVILWAVRWYLQFPIGYRDLERALVQTFGINATKRSGTLRGSCGENSIPDFWRPVVFDAKLSEFELTFPDPMHEFNAGDGN